MPPRPPPLTAPRNPSSFHRTLLNPLLAKPLAKSLVQDPLVLQLNIDIYMLAPSEHTFGSALQVYITKLDKCENTNDASAYARACLEVLVVYSLMRMRYEWLDTWCCDGDVRRAATGLVLGKRKGGNSVFGDDSDSDKHDADTANGDPGSTKTVNGDSWIELRGILVDYFRKMDMELGLHEISFERWDPRASGTPGPQERKKAFVGRLEGERDLVVGEACVLALCPTVSP